MHFGQATVQRAAGVGGPIVRGHVVALFDDVLLADLKRIHMEFCRQLIDCGFHRKQALRCAVTAVSTRRHVVGVDHIIGKAECFCLGIKRDGFVAGQAHRGGAVLAVSARIGERMHINAFDDALFGSTQPEMDLHLMAGRRSDLAFYPAENDLGGFLGLPGHKSRVNLADVGLLGPKTAADAGFDDPDHGFGNMQGIGHIAAGMEDDLRRAENVQTSIQINGAIRAECFHHGLLAGLGMVGVFNDDIAVCQHSFNVAVSLLTMGTKIAFVVGSNRAEGLPVFLRMDQNRVILGRVVIQNSVQHLVLHFDESEGLVHAFFVFAGHNGNDIAHKTDMAVDEQAVTGTGLRERLACLGIPGSILRDVFPGKNRLNARHLFGHRRIDGLDNRVGVGRAEQLDDEAVGRNEIVHVNWLARYQLHGIFFAVCFADGFHSAASCFCFFQARKFKIPRSWPS